MDNHGKRPHSGVTIASTVVQQHNVGARDLGAGKVRLGELLDHVCGELLRRTPGSSAPVVRVEFCSHGNVTHVLCQAQRLDLLGGIGLCITRMRWLEEQRLYGQLGVKRRSVEVSSRRMRKLEMLLISGCVKV